MARNFVKPNEKYGMLTTVKRVENGKHGSVRWLCYCDCGKEKVTRSSSLRSGDTKSCGCIFKVSDNRKCEECGSNDSVSRNRKTGKLLCKYHASVYHRFGTLNPIKKRWKSPNKIIVDDDISKICLYNNEGLIYDFTIISTEKNLLVKDKIWSKDGNGYVISKDKIYLHRLVMNAKKGDIVDHIDGNPLNNTDENLQIITHQQNIMKAKKPKNNTSGVVGVSFNKKYKKWEAHITYDYKKINLGFHENIDDAIRARKEAEKKYFGKFKPLE